MYIEIILLLSSVAIVIAGGLFYSFEKKHLDSDTKGLSKDTKTSSFDSIDSHNSISGISKSELIHIFIVNPVVCRPGFYNALSSKLNSINDFNYFIYISRAPEDETRIVKRLQSYFSGTKLRFYCCGGSGTIRNVLNGIEDFQRVELAFLAQGLTNDFLKTFDADINLFSNLDELINGEVIKVDYIRSNRGLALNSFSTGVDANTLSIMDGLRSFSVLGKNVPYVLALILSVFFLKPVEYEITIDGKHYDRAVNQIFFGNGGVLGGVMIFKNKAIVTDGLASYSIGKQDKGFKLVPIVRALAKADYDSLCKFMSCGMGKKITIKRKDGKNFQVDMDGEMCEEGPVWNATVVHKGLSFVVPKGVKAYE